MSNLFYVDKLIKDVISEHVDADGVITDEGMKALFELEGDRDNVIDGMIKSHKNEQVLVDGIDAEITRLKLRKEYYKNKQSSIMTAIRPYLTEGEKIETAEYILKWTTSSPLVGLENFDAELCFANKKDDLHEYVIKKVTPATYKFDMNAIKKMIKKAGNEKDFPMEIYIDTIKNPKIT
jgi:hypothetical protein